MPRTNRAKIFGCICLGLVVLGFFFLRDGEAHRSPGNRPITPGSSIGRALEEVVKEEEIKNVLEIGGNRGDGSTLIIANALKEQPGKKLVVIELNGDLVPEIKRQTANLPVQVVLGTSVGAAKLRLPGTEAEKAERDALKAEMEKMEQLAGQPVLERLCQETHFEAVLVDGSPYAAEAELDIIINKCKPEYLFVFDYGYLPAISWTTMTSGEYWSKKWTLYKNPAGNVQPLGTDRGAGHKPPPATPPPATPPPPTPPPPTPAPGRKDSYAEYTIWSTDMHIATIADLKDLFQRIKGPSIIDKSLSGACHQMGTCARDLRVLNSGNSMFLQGGKDLKQQFFESYKKDPQMQSVDAFICMHPSSTCEIYLPFNKSVIISAPSRFEQGREEDKAGWQKWADTVRQLGKSSRHVVAGNNLYDVEYIRYFTGLKKEEVLWIPAYCGYATSDYVGDRKEFLYGTMHLPGIEPGVWPRARDWVNEAIAKKNANIVVRGIHELYGHYKYSDLGHHPAIIHVPYQVSIMSLFEHYRMNIPLFFPSVNFLCELHKKYYAVPERTFWPGVRNGISGRHDIVLLKGSLIPKHPEYPMATDYDPNDDYNDAAVKHWMGYADFYQWPHVILYDSWDDLVDKLMSTDFKAISAGMKVENERLLKELDVTWTTVFDRMWKDRPKGGFAIPQTDYDTAMRDLGFTP